MNFTATHTVWRDRFWAKGARFACVSFVLSLCAMARAEPPVNVKQLAKTIIAERTERNRTIFADEQLAQRYEHATFIPLWDHLRAARDKFKVFAGFELDEIVIGQPGQAQSVLGGILTCTLKDHPKRLNRSQWREVVSQIKAQGFQVVQTEWHHERFGTDSSGHRISTVNLSIHATNRDGTVRYQIEGPIQVRWADPNENSGRIVAASIDTTGLAMKWRRGAPVFNVIELAELDVWDGGEDILAYDLDGDGLVELLCPATNDLFWNRGGGDFVRRKLLKHPMMTSTEAAIADFTGDGRPDLLVAGLHLSLEQRRTDFSLFLYEQDEQGTFSRPGQSALEGNQVVKLRNPMSFAVGDVDGDHDLDVYLGQYKQPYAQGNFPQPYDNANDGYPSYLLHNRGNGRFVDVTQRCGLAAKRFRRTYGSSLVDLDDDRDLDLLVTSDFAGTDIYLNNGHGQFTDITESAVDEAASFGMSHTFADFNADGKLDFYVAGMASTTARRLEAMNVRRADLPEFDQVRIKMAFGNRMYLHAGPGRYRQPPFRTRVARSGWTWGTAALDVNNDGYPDIYAANGHLSNTSAADYCSTFWCHDIYEGSHDHRARDLVYHAGARESIKTGESWNGFEKNHLFLNLGGQDFANVAFLMGAAFVEDCRAVLAEDFDGDGRMDLLVSSQVGNPFDRKKWRLRLLLNQADLPDHHWIGVRLRGAPGISPIGARVNVTYEDAKQTGAIVTGDSFRVQHAAVQHFGLGKHAAVHLIEVRWPNGDVSRLKEPEVDQYHLIGAGQ